MSEEIKSLKNYISTTKNEIFTTFKIETISNLIIYYEDLQQKVEQLENMRKEAVDYMKENCDIITIDRGWIIRSELTTTGLGKLFKILNKGDNNGK